MESTTGGYYMKKNFFSCATVAVLILSACMQSPTPASSPPPVTAVHPTSTPTPQGRTLIVTSAADSGPGTLRQAMEEAQNGDTITFDSSVFPPDAPVTIFIAGELPHIGQGSLTIDASDAGVILNGSNATDDWLAGLQIVESDANVIRGLQITNFSGPGIAIAGNAKHNIIGGDRSIGSGPFGQGNLITLNDIGIHLKTKNTSLNTITGNLIGTDAEGAEALGNNLGVLIESATKNTIGPNNIIAYNVGLGITLSLDATENTIGPDNTITHNGEGSIWAVYPEIVQNTFTRNIIRDNYTEDRRLAAPIIFDFDLQAGTLSGAACVNCTVEIFSGETVDGAIYEGMVSTDGRGILTFVKGSPFTGPYLIAAATDADGNTSEFSRPTSSSVGSLGLQRGNDLPKSIFRPMEPRELADNRLSTQNETGEATVNMYDWLLANVISQGVKHIRLAFNDFEVPFDPAPIEFFVSPIADAWIDSIISNGISITYVLTFWDKELQIGGGEVGCPRFKAEAETQRYLEYVRFIVGHFRDRIHNFEIWNEPNSGACPQAIEPADYVELVRRTVPVIRQENPEAKVIVGALGSVNWLNDPYARDYLFTILSSDVMPMVDGISWHPFYGASPQYADTREYYFTYPSFVQSIKDTASASGFRGEYFADELVWRTRLNALADHPWTYSETVSAKYHARMVILHRGMDVIVAAGADDRLSIIHSTLRNLATSMAGASPTQLRAEIESDATPLTSYGFSLSNGDKLFAVWSDGVAVDYDPGILSTLIFPGTSPKKVIGIDVLHGFEQELITEMENGNLVIRNFLIKDYPIILRLVR
jgi:hypothetical protein